MSRTAAALALLAGVAAGCDGASRENELVDPFEDRLLGELDVLVDSGLSELLSPADLLVVAQSDHLVAFVRKDPNNGCRLLLVGELPDSDVVPAGAAFYDACHGHAYDRAGAPLDPGNSTRMWELPTEIRDGRLFWVVAPAD